VHLARIAALVLIILTTLWVGYFGVVARGDAGGSGRRRVALAILHVPLPPGLVFLAVGLATLLSDSKTLLHGGVGWLLIAPLAPTLLALAGLSLVSAGRAAAPVAEGLVAAAIVALVVALATPHVVWLTPVVATWAAALPFVLAVVGLHHRQAARSRREAAAA
jgi:low temperature requirement protein LtrA